MRRARQQLVHVSCSGTTTCLVLLRCNNCSDPVMQLLAPRHAYLPALAEHCLSFFQVGGIQCIMTVDTV